MQLHSLQPAAAVGSKYVYYHITHCWSQQHHWDYDNIPLTQLTPEHVSCVIFSSSSCHDREINIDIKPAYFSSLTVCYGLAQPGVLSVTASESPLTHSPPAALIPPALQQPPAPAPHITSHHTAAGPGLKCTLPPSLRMFSASDQCSVTVTVLCLCKCLIPTPVAAQTKHGRGSVCERR